jgi:ParB family chromosome partitioning protein
MPATLHDGKVTSRRGSARIYEVTNPAAVPIECIDGDEGNVRSRLVGIDELTASIRTHGIVQPLVGMRTADGRIQLIAGHRRLAAARAVGLSQVPMILRTTSETVAKEIQLVENVQREDLPALDVSEALLVMHREPQSAEQIAERVGKSAAWVRRHLALLKIDPKVIDAIRKYGLRFTQAEHVAKVLKSGTVEAAIEAAKAMSTGQLSRRAAEKKAEGTDGTKHTFTWSGDACRAKLTVESHITLDSVRQRQLQELVEIAERIMGQAA